MKKQCTIKFWNAGNIVANFMTLTIGFHNNVHQWSLKISETVGKTLTFCICHCYSELSDFSSRRAEFGRLAVLGCTENLPESLDGVTV